MADHVSPQHASSGVRGRLPPLLPLPWHAVPEPDLLEVLHTRPDGLTLEDARNRLDRYGPNRLAAKPRRSGFLRFLDQFRSPLIYILIGVALIAFLLGKTFDVWVILGIALLNATLGYLLESRAAGAIAALQRMTSPFARVVREEEIRQIPADQVVPGDILVLEGGDRVAADARLLKATELTVNEAELTGESIPAQKHPGVLEAGDGLPLGDRTNMVFMNTSVATGRGRAVVTATGMSTVMGGIARDVAAAGTLPPIQRRLEAFARKLALAIAGCLSFVVIAGLLLGHPFLEILYVAATLAVAAIPEGLPIVVSVLFAIGVTRMARRHALVRRLPAVEGLGSASVICSDKTGTLTRNAMTVERLYLGDRWLSVEGGGYAPRGRILEDGYDVDPAAWPGLRWLGVCAWLCNDATLVEREGNWTIIGDPTEGALKVLAEKLQIRTEWDRLQELPFSAERKWMAVLDRAPDGERVVFVKGALERLLPMATAWVDAAGEAHPLEEAARARIRAAAEEMAGGALRVLALGMVRRVAAADTFSAELLPGRLALLGLAGMIDPPRPEAITAIEVCERAGIRVVMITGDHRTTAEAIARQLGLLKRGGASEVVDGPELEAMPRQTLAERIDRIAVYARVTPAHKLRIVDGLQAKGMIVAMTGDGVNDAPALAQADVGIAMGITGTEVAKGASDVVLADDNFATIVAAIEEGRTISDNLRKVLPYLMTTSIANILTITVALFAALPLPLLPVQVLWINLVTDGLFDKTLALEKSEPGLMTRRPEAAAAPLVGSRAVLRMLFLGSVMALGTLATYMWEMGTSETHARTEAFTTMVAFQWFSAFTYRSFDRSIFQLRVNYWMLGALSLGLLLQLGAVYLPPLQVLLGTEPLRAGEFLVSILTGSLLLVASELAHLVRALKKRARRRAAYQSHENA